MNPYFTPQADGLESKIRTKADAGEFRCHAERAGKQNRSYRTPALIIVPATGIKKTDLPLQEARFHFSESLSEEIFLELDVITQQMTEICIFRYTGIIIISRDQSTEFIGEAGAFRHLIGKHA